MTHTHTHEHEHDHDADTYYLDQLCLIALSGAFAAVCLTLYFLQAPMLRLMLAPQFHKFVLWSGIALAVLVLVRAVALWCETGKPAHAHDHACGHEHSHEHGHTHAHEHEHGHVHGPEHSKGSATAVAEGDPPALPHAPTCDHSHTHAHAGGHTCSHGHEHAWAPWKYVLLLLPIMLYLLGLPNKLPPVRGSAVVLDVTQEARSYASLVALGGAPLQQAALVGTAFGDHASGDVKKVGFKELDSFAYDPVEMEHWRGKTVQVLGQFSPDPRNDKFFNLIRRRIQCCGADATPVPIPMVCRESVASIPQGEWVLVTGEVAFTEVRPGTFLTFLRVARRDNLQRSDPDPNPYIQ
jgi:hypothetical protein